MHGCMDAWTGGEINPWIRIGGDGLLGDWYRLPNVFLSYKLTRNV